MYVRACPRIDKELLETLIQNKYKPNFTDNDNKLFFNSGGSALKFFLSALPKSSKVGIQVFTCSIVLDAILESEHLPVFLDTNNMYFSTLIDDLKGHEDIDVLILTHLFGIPNPDFLSINVWAKENNVLIINDLCTTVKAKVNDSYIEDLSTFYFYSFNFDKPVSAMCGGMLKIDDEDILDLKKKYSTLKTDSINKGIFLLKKLLLFHELLSSNNYKTEFRTNSLYEILIIKICSLKISSKKLFYLLSLPINRIFYRIECHYFKSRTNLKIRKMSNIHKYYVQKQIQNFENNNKIVAAALTVLRKELPDEILNNMSVGLRFAILCENSNDLILKLKKKNIEAGKHNWNHLLDECGYYPQATYIVKNLINIPVWNENIWLNV